VLGVLTAILGDLSAVSRAGLITLPTVDQTQDGGSFSATTNGLLGTGAYTNQLFYTSSLLGSLPVGSQITGIAVRVNGPLSTGTYPTTDLSWNNYDVTLAQAATAFSSMGSNVSANMLNPVQVYSDSLTVLAGTFADVGTPGNPFTKYLTFTTPYTYQGGDLILLVSHDAGSGTGFRVDAEDERGYGTTWKQRISESYDPTTVSGTTIAPIVQLEFTSAIPEPTSLVLTATLATVTGIARYKAERNRRNVRGQARG
jgi:hypothetical protein